MSNLVQLAPRPPEPAPQQGRHRRSPRRAVALVAVALVLLALTPVAASVRTALTAPGQASTSMRLVEWMRDHGGGPVVNLVENWWYARNAPQGAAPDPAMLPAIAAGATAAAGSGSEPPLLRSAVSPPLPGEATWHGAAGRPGVDTVDTGYFRPLLQAPSVIVGTAWIDQSRTRTQLLAGTRDPQPPVGVKSVDGRGAKVPGSDRARLLATFNSGFRMKDSQGGYFANGQEIAPLRDGAASLVVDAAGRVDIGAWGRDLRLGPSTAAVRQNLDLIVEQGAAVPGLDSASNAWGTSKNQFQYTWRSGLGVDRNGNLVYVAADRITLADLASSLAAAGAVRGMQLDIHPQLVTFMTYRPDQAVGAGNGTRLLPAMIPPTNRYLVVSQRDFLAVTSR